jgi:hypothetical protein
MDPQRRLVALWFCRIRALLGLKLTLFPGTIGRLWFGRPTPGTKAAVRMLGVRDLALGLGGVAGVREGTQAPVTPGLPKRARLTGLLAAGAAVVGMKLAWELADERAEAEVEARHAARLAAPDF